MERKGHLFIISGPSGVGKGTIANSLLETFETMEFSVSMTTRQPRPGEEEGVHYYFVDDAAFLKKIEEDGFLEYAGVFGNFYGTPKALVEQALEEGRDVLLDIDVQGALQVMKKRPDAVGIFILPPSLGTLRGRLLGRGTETEEKVALRLGKAVTEMESIENYKYYIINDNLEEAIETAKSIVRAVHSEVTPELMDFVGEFKEEI